MVIDGMDNFETRFILNSACVAEGIPFIHGGIKGLLGEITTNYPLSSGKPLALPAFCLVFRRDGIYFWFFGVTPALIATLQVMEMIKLLVGFEDLLTGKLLYVDGESMKFTFLNLSRRSDCKVCGEVKET